MRGVVAVVAVRGVGHEAGGLITSLSCSPLVAVAVAVGVLVPDGAERVVLVHLFVAVVVLAVAELVGVRVRRGLEVVAVVAIVVAVPVAVLCAELLHRGVFGEAGVVGGWVVALVVAGAGQEQQRQAEVRERARGQQTQGEA